MGKFAWAGLALLWSIPMAAEDISPIQEELDRLRERVSYLEGQSGSASEEGAEEIQGWRPKIPEATLGGFASINFSYAHGRVRADAPGTDIPDPSQPWLGREDRDEFVLGDLDFFVASQLSERFTFLSEILMEFDDYGAKVYAERLLLRYEHADWLRVATGRGHTAIGYWNKHRHHGAWLWTTTQRPRLFRFEDQGGPLPTHFVGIEAAGLRETDFGLLDYNLVVANGRADDAREVSITGDLNDGKMVAFSLGFSPSVQPGFSIGANILYDEVAANSDAVGTEWMDHDIYETIAGGYLVYEGPALRLMLESQYIHHRTGGKTYDSYGGYAQISYRVRKLIPYYRFDWLSMADDDPFYREYTTDTPAGGLPYVVDLHEHTVGVRYDWAHFVAVKLEYRYLDSELEQSNTVALQASLAF